MELYYILVLFVTAVFKVINCERLHEQMYSSIEGGAACFRRLNGTHQAGCTSSEKGAVGVVHMISNASDAEWILKEGKAGPYMAVVSTSLFYDVVETILTNPDNVAGVLLYNDANPKASAFTQESRCPNEYSSGSGTQCSSTLSSGIVWNEKGTNLLRRDIPFPIFFLPQSRAEEILKIKQCYNRYNLDRSNQKGMPLCSLQLNSFMYAAVNSVVCMRRSASSALFSTTKVCDPLGDHNVYYSLFPRGNKTANANKKVNLVTARIDTASLFDGVAPGAASSVVGMATLISAATTLAKMIPASDANLYKNNVLWTLFNGEAFDYIGSQRVAHDILHRKWPMAAPLSHDDVRLHLEIGQIGGSLAGSNDSSWPLYAFTPKSDLPQIDELLQIMNKYMKQNSMSLQPLFTSNIPPSSLHSFRRILKNVTESGALPELLLVDFEKQFTNLFYHSALDDYGKIGYGYHNISFGNDGTFISTDELIANGTMKDSEPQVKIARLATVVAQTLYRDVTETEYTGSMAASAHLVDELLYCFLRSQSCRLLKAADYASGSGAEAGAKPVPLYVGVAAWSNAPAVFAGHLLALLTGDHLAVNRSACDAHHNLDYSYYWLKGWNHSGICIQTTMNFSQALSPAFIIQDYDLSSGVYSTWTESVWQAMWARVFVSAGGGGARVAGVAGGVVTALAAFFTFWLRRHARLLFHDGSVITPHATAGILRSVNC